MSWKRVWKRLLGVERTVIESLDFDEVANAVVVGVRPDRRYGRRCGICLTLCPGYDQQPARRWRALDGGLVRVFVQAQVGRVRCAEHGVVVQAVPWARHGAGHTKAFDETVAWLATRCAKTAISELMRTSWRTVGSIITRVVDDIERAHPGLTAMAGVRRIGIDEVSYRRGHKYLTVVVDHDTGRMLWAAPGRDKKTLGQFFEALGEEGCRALELVSSDGADWIADLVALRAKNAVQCMDPFHVVAWVQAAMDKVRNTTRRKLRQAGDKQGNLMLHRARYSLWKNPENLTPKQLARRDLILASNADLATAYRLKEDLRAVFATADRAVAASLLATWHHNAAASGLSPFVELERKMRRFDEDILNAVEHQLTNARSEGFNLQIRFLTRIAYGFHSPQALLSLVKLKIGGYPVWLPGR